jgi:hypothetical protein
MKPMLFPPIYRVFVVIPHLQKTTTRAIDRLPSRQASKSGISVVVNAGKPPVDETRDNDVARFFLAIPQSWGEACPLDRNFAPPPFGRSSHFAGSDFPRVFPSEKQGKRLARLYSMERVKDKPGKADKRQKSPLFPVSYSNTRSIPPALARVM